MRELERREKENDREVKDRERKRDWEREGGTRERERKREIMSRTLLLQELSSLSPSVTLKLYTLPYSRRIGARVQGSPVALISTINQTLSF